MKIFSSQKYTPTQAENILFLPEKEKFSGQE